MLRSVESKYDLRFVEKVGTKTEIQNIFKFPAIVGHGGTVAPLICNGKISKLHCTITHDLVAQTYRVQDGVEGKPSTNHIYFNDEIIDAVDLSKPGELVYLIRTIDGTEAYLELYDPRKSFSYECPTQDLDPRLVRTEAKVDEASQKASEAHAIAVKNKEHLDEIDGKLGAALTIGKYIGDNPFKVFLTILIVGFALFTFTPFFLLYNYKDQLFEESIRRYKDVNGTNSIEHSK